jgi:hypothetical protein
MNKFETALDRIKKNVEIQDSWTEEDLEYYKTIISALEIASDLCKVNIHPTEKGGADE